MRRLSRSLAVVTALLALAAAPQAQGPGEGLPLHVGAQRVPVQVTTGAVYQQFADDGAALGQLALPLTGVVPVTEGVGLSLRASYASASGDDLASVGGLADAQAAVSVHRALGAGAAVASLSVNLPTGGGVATAEEAETAFLLGQGFYGFRLPSLGQGFNATPALTYAFPLSERLALGAGASYQYRGAFEPLGTVDDPYDPGDEVLLTAGLDYRLTEASTLALDASYVHYGEDTWGALAYTTGDAVSVTAQWAAALGGHEVRVLGRVRRKADTEVPPETAALLALDAAVPTQARLAGHVRLRLGERLYLGALAQGRYYDASEAFDAKTLLDVGVLPEYALTPGLRLTIRLGATVGDLRGFEAGAGLAWGL